jgi:hypothetical protein
MKTIETTVIVGPDRTITLPVPEDIVPGTHRVVVVIEEAPEAVPPAQPLDLPLLPAVAWPENLSLRREDMYGDWGR